jgi:hypothetical protein
MVLYDDLLKDEDYSGELRPDVEAALTKETTEVRQIFTSTNLSGIRIFPGSKRFRIPKNCFLAL